MIKHERDHETEKIRRENQRILRQLQIMAKNLCRCGDSGHYRNFFADGQRACSFVDNCEQHATPAATDTNSVNVSNPSEPTTGGRFLT